MQDNKQDLFLLSLTIAKLSVKNLIKYLVKSLLTKENQMHKISDI